MSPPARLFGPDRVEITDLDSWLCHAPPEKGEAQWRDGYSAKEQAKAWLRSGRPALPAELWSSISDLGPVGVDEVYGRPEHQTRLDRYSGARQHDLFACARRDGETVLVVGIEAKACEDFAGAVADRAASGPRSNKRARCNLLARALFGREVLDEGTGEVLDERLGRHGYQLWTAAVGTIMEAQQREVPSAVLAIYTSSYLATWAPPLRRETSAIGDPLLPLTPSVSTRSWPRCRRRARDRTTPTSSRPGQRFTWSRSTARSTGSRHPAAG